MMGVKLGAAMAASTARMATVTINSMAVNPPWRADSGGGDARIRVWYGCMALGDELLG